VWPIMCGILTVLSVGWSLCFVVCGLIALTGYSTFITETWCVDAGAGGFFASVRALPYLMPHIHVVRALYVCIAE